MIPDRGAGYRLGIPVETGSVMPAPLGDYQVPFIGSKTAATALAGLVGTVLAFIAAYLLARVLVPALGAPKKDASSGT